MNQLADSVNQLAYSAIQLADSAIQSRANINVFLYVWWSPIQSIQRPDSVNQAADSVNQAADSAIQRFTESLNQHSKTRFSESGNGWYIRLLRMLQGPCSDAGGQESHWAGRRGSRRATSSHGCGPGQG